LTQPWPALQHFAAKYDVDAADTMERSHVPFVVILLRKLKDWQDGHEGKLPAPSADRKGFTDSINSFRRAENADDENVEEALGALGQHVWRPISAGTEGIIPAHIRALFEDPLCDDLTSKVSDWSRS